MHGNDPIKICVLCPIPLTVNHNSTIGLYTIAGWTVRVLDAHHNELVTSVCELRPGGLFIATDGADHGLEVGGRVLVFFCSGDLHFELGASTFVVGWCAELGMEGIGLHLDALVPELSVPFQPAQIAG